MLFGDWVAGLQGTASGRRARSVDIVTSSTLLLQMRYGRRCCKSPKGGDGKINLDELEKYKDVEVKPDLLRAFLNVKPDDTKPKEKKKPPK